MQSTEFACVGLVQFHIQTDCERPNCSQSNKQGCGKKRKNCPVYWTMQLSANALSRRKVHTLLFLLSFPPNGLVGNVKQHQKFLRGTMFFHVGWGILSLRSLITSTKKQRKVSLSFEDLHSNIIIIINLFKSCPRIANPCGVLHRN